MEARVRSERPPGLTTTSRGQRNLDPQHRFVAVESAQPSLGVPNEIIHNTPREVLGQDPALGGRSGMAVACRHRPPRQMAARGQALTLTFGAHTWSGIRCHPAVSNGIAHHFASYRSSRFPQARRRMSPLACRYAQEPLTRLSLGTSGSESGGCRRTARLKAYGTAMGWPE
jgi:hypothetical protein